MDTAVDGCGCIDGGGGAQAKAAMDGGPVKQGFIDQISCSTIMLDLSRHGSNGRAVVL